jgi:hypothetical protein
MFYHPNGVSIPGSEADKFIGEANNASQVINVRVR